MSRQNKEKKNKKMVPLGTGMALGAGAAVLGACRWLFNYAIERKRWNLHGVMYRLLEGNGEPDPYYQEVDRAEEELKKIPYEPVSLISIDGKKLKGRFYPGQEGVQDVFLAVHGCRNHGTREYSFLSSYYRKAGVPFLLIDLRACGDSEGDYMTYGWKESEDLLLWISWLIGKCGESCRIFLHGISMGAGTVLMTGDKELPEQVAGVVADCGYTSACDEFAYQIKKCFHMPMVAPILFLTNLISKKKAGFDIRKAAPIEAVKTCKVPHLFIHGDKDDYVPYYMMDELYEACNARKWKVTVPGAVHARSYYVNPELYEESLEKFRKEV